MWDSSSQIGVPCIAGRYAKKVTTQIESSATGSKKRDQLAVMAGPTSVGFASTFRLPFIYAFESLSGTEGCRKPAANLPMITGSWERQFRFGRLRYHVEAGNAARAVAEAIGRIHYSLGARFERPGCGI